MCQSKANGGRRCPQTVTSRALTRLRRKYSSTHDKALLGTIQQVLEGREEYGPHVAPLSLTLPLGVNQLISEISEYAQPLLVGGTVRDALRGDTNPKDFDIEVYHVSLDDLADRLRRDGYVVDEVGKSFGVLKVRTRGEADDIDISVPRRDSLVGSGHQGFSVETSEDLDIIEASARRDFTINAMMYDHQKQLLIDPHNGSADLQKKVLRHVSDAFAEDPLRALRGFQFAARYGMTLDPETAKLCQQLAPRAQELASERIATEWDKFYSKGQHLGQGLQALHDAGWDTHVNGLAEINTQALRDTLDKAHSWSKTQTITGEQKQALYASIFLSHLKEKDQQDFSKKTLIGSKVQSSALQLSRLKVDDEVTPYMVRRAAQQASTAGVSLRLWAAREALLGRSARAEAVSSLAEQIGCLDGPEEPLVMGRDVLERTSRLPGKWLGALLKDAEEAQYQGAFTTQAEGLSWIDRKLTESK